MQLGSNTLNPCVLDLCGTNGGNDKGFPDVMTTWVKRVNAGLEIWPAKRKEVVG